MSGLFQDREASYNEHKGKKGTLPTSECNCFINTLEAALYVTARCILDTVGVSLGMCPDCLNAGRQVLNPVL